MDSPCIGDIEREMAILPTLRICRNLWKVRQHQVPSMNSQVSLDNDCDEQMLNIERARWHRT